MYYYFCLTKNALRLFLNSKNILSLFQERRRQVQNIKNLLSKTVTYMLHACISYSAPTVGRPWHGETLSWASVGVKIMLYLNISKSCPCPGREVMNSMNRCGEGCCRMNNRCCQLVPRLEEVFFLCLCLYFWCHRYFFSYDGLSVQETPESLDTCVQ